MGVRAGAGVGRDRGTNGDGWVWCDVGHRHWGRFGAAGLLVTADLGVGPGVLLAHRVSWSHHGDTWGIPGGARDGAESAEDAALREAEEETGLDPAAVVVTHRSTDDHGGWAYTTVHATLTTAPPALVPRDGESTELRWVPVADVGTLVLHPGFADFWAGPHAPSR